MILLKISAEFFGGLMVGFNSPDLANAFCQGNCNYAGASTDIEHKVTFFEITMSDELECKAR